MCQLYSFQSFKILQTAMITAFGIVVIIVGLLVYIGQFLSFFAPDLATKLGLNSPEADMDGTLYLIETKANGLSDILLTWTFPLAGLLLIIGHPYWPFFALVGSGIYLYFALFTIFARVFLSKEGKKVGSPSDLKIAYGFSTIWIVSSIILIVLAIQKLTI